MSRFYRWSMRNGARILFMISLLLLLTGLWPVLYGLFSLTSEMSGSHYYTPEVEIAGLQSQMLIQALINAVGAAALHRADRADAAGIFRSHGGRKARLRPRPRRRDGGHEDTERDHPRTLSSSFPRKRESRRGR